MKRMLVVCAIALAACGDKPNCAGIAKHTAALATAELDKQAQGADANQRERLELDRKMIPIGEASTRERCQKERWTADKIACVQRAKAMAEVAQCK